MVHGVFNPQYQRYREKILIGTYLKESNFTYFSLSCYLKNEIQFHYN
jgi:hypothetical protein